MVMTNVNTRQMAKVALSGSDPFNILIRDPGECKWHVNSICTWTAGPEKVMPQTVPGARTKEENQESTWPRDELIGLGRMDKPQVMNGLTGQH